MGGFSSSQTVWNFTRNQVLQILCYLAPADVPRRTGEVREVIYLLHLIYIDILAICGYYTIYGGYYTINFVGIFPYIGLI